MERELCLVLDTKGYTRLVLKKGSMSELDSYTSKYFESNADIKKRYQKEIEKFLDENKEKLQNSKDPNYKGRLAIVLKEKVGGEYTEYQKAVLLKKHIVIFNEYIKHERVMKRFVKKYFSLFSEMMFIYVNSRWDINCTKSKIDDWLKDLKSNKEDYYAVLRKFIAFYDNLSKDKMINMKLPTIDEFYKEYKEDKELKLSLKIKEKQPLKLHDSNHEIIKDSINYEDKIYVVNGNRYTIDELEQFDLDDNAEYECDIVPDGLGYEKRIR